MVSRRAFFNSTLGFLAAAVAAPFLPKPRLAMRRDAFEIVSRDLEKSIASKGVLLTGGSLNDLKHFAANHAKQEYIAAFNHTAPR